jgi:Asp-tRNA(Asn)/Glu-tRNA(Gln) amidotransferase A subunit family amidase
VQLPDAGAIAPAHRAIAFSEASSIHEEFLRTSAAQYGANVRLRQEAGRGVMASEYLKAFGLRGRFARAFSEAWRDVDVVVTPTSPTVAAPIGTESITTGSRGGEPTHTVYTRYSAPLSTLGLPALSLPCGFSEAGMPVGLQLCGPPHSEPLLFYVAAAYEAATPWHRRHPELPVAARADGRKNQEHSHA